MIELNKIYRGDCLELMKQIEDNFVDAIITDPPYGLSFMGKKWDYEVPSQEIWQECLRVLKPGGYLLSFAGTRTQHRMAVRIEDAGFEIRDMIAWVYGSGFPKSLNIGKAMDGLLGKQGKGFVSAGDDGRKAEFKQDLSKRSDYGYKFEPQSENAKEWEGWGTALKPALEPITVARKPLSEKTVAENVLKWGTGGINIDGCRVGTEERTEEYNIGRNMKHQDGWNNHNLKSIIKTTTGRFPANFIHDGSDEVVGLFPNTKSGNLNNGHKRGDGTGNSFMGGGGTVTGNYGGDSGSASRFFYCAKASKSERNRGCEGLEEKESKKMDGGTFESASTTATERTSKNNHPTVKPIALMEYLIKLVTPPKGIVLDPFIGSGTTGVACVKLGFNFIGIEKECEYVKIAELRIGEYLKQTKLNDDKIPSPPPFP